jgi:hypothetical protein
MHKRNLSKKLKSIHKKKRSKYYLNRKYMSFLKKNNFDLLLYNYILPKRKKIKIKFFKNKKILKAKMKLYK